jgi:hypothetical protein
VREAESKEDKMEVAAESQLYGKVGRESRRYVEWGRGAGLKNRVKYRIKKTTR